MLCILALVLLSILLIRAKCKVSTDPVTYDLSKGKYPTPFRGNELVVIYKNPPTEAQRQTIRDSITAQGKTVTNIQSCNGCKGYVELWSGTGLHTVIRSEGVSGGSGGTGSKGVGEDSVARYSLNFLSSLPLEVTRSLDSIAQYPNPDKSPAISGLNKDTILIAVLDTGIDTVNFVNGKYLWTNVPEKKGGDDNNCYPDDAHGWNFIGENAFINDDGRNRHGTIVSSYIVDEFRAAHARGTNTNFVQIMPLKTHDATGTGDLFSSICAILYAVDKGAHIINASWGFYYYEARPHPYMDSLITSIVRDKGILFITAAGNQSVADDARARSVLGTGVSDIELRNLDRNRFYPATLSAEKNNVLTVTTTDSMTVSPTQNHSSTFVDLGVRADSLTPGRMLFMVPFTRPVQYISGSSFATAVASGKIGAYVPKHVYRPGIHKLDVFANLEQMMRNGTIPPIMSASPPLNSAGQVRNGRISKRR